MINTNMRKGFTMIELVFVIVIIGILAAVALPRFTGISDDAHVSKLQAFVGTLNRTTGPSIWSGLQRAEPTVNGSVASSTIAKFNTLGTQASALGADAQIDTIPSEFTGAPTSLNLASCDTTTPRPTLPAIGAVYTPGGTALGTTGTIGTTTYSLYCLDSDLSTAPAFFLIDDTTGFMVSK